MGPHNGVVSRNRLVDIDDEVRFHDPPDLVQLVHEIGPVVEPPGSICKHHVNIVRRCVLDGIKENRRWIGPMLVLDDLDPEPAGMLVDLLDGPCPEGVSCADDN